MHRDGTDGMCDVCMYECVTSEAECGMLMRPLSSSAAMDMRSCSFCVTSCIAMNGVGACMYVCMYCMRFRVGYHGLLEE